MLKFSARSLVQRWFRTWKHAVKRLVQLPQGPFDVFLESNALQINEARLQHLASLGLPLKGQTVLEVGAGIGLHTYFFEERDCSILSVDARLENVAEIHRRYPTRRAEVLDLEQASDLLSFGEFEIVYCYGLLYHLSDPEAALTKLAAVCQGLLLLETCVTPGNELEVYRVTEDAKARDQAFSGYGCRPTRPWLMQALRKHLGHAYTTQTQPNHPDFEVDWVNPAKKPLHRAVFVGARHPLNLPTLCDVLPDTQSLWLGL